MMVNDEPISDPSPINRLSQDILWRVFLMNANMFDPLEYDIRKQEPLTQTSALDTTLASSHVCKSWRTLLLESTTIWGSILRLDRLYQLGTVGSTEILRRTGIAPLCIMGGLFGDSEQEAASRLYGFVELLLQTNWWRIKRFHVSVHEIPELPHSLWDTFELEAPNLEWFCFSYQPPVHQLVSNLRYQYQVNLFANHAPSMKHFCANAITFVAEDARWLGQLRSLELNSSGVQTPDVLTAIKHMPRLESLHLSDLPGELDPHSVQSESIPLPHLADLRLTLPFHTSIAFARSIKPATNCAISYCAEPDHEVDVNDKDIFATIEVLERYAALYFSTPMDAVAIQVGQDWDYSFNFSAWDIDHPAPWVQEPESPFPYFSIKLPLFPRRLNPSIFFAPFLKCDLSLVKTLHFHKPLISNVPCVFLEALSGVKYLNISDANLIWVNLFYDKTKRLFLGLRNLHISRTGMISMVKQGFYGLRSRSKAANIPFIKLLVLGRDPEGDWSFLEEEHGLTVAWMIGDSPTILEYVWVWKSRKIEFSRTRLKATAIPMIMDLLG